MKAFGFIEFVMFKGKHTCIYVRICVCIYIYIHYIYIYIYLSDTHECRPLKKMLQTFSVPDKSLAIDTFFIYKTFKYTSRGKKITH